LVSAGGLRKDAQALPFNDDMVNVQRTGRHDEAEKCRALLPSACSGYHVATREEAEAQTNPLKGNARSTAEPERGCSQ
jgi:polyhydroxyalkanoate synthesis regulator phasin